MIWLALRNLRSHRGRNVMTALSVMMAMALFTFTVAALTQMSGVGSYLSGRNNMMVSAKGGEMPLSTKDKVLAVPGVKRLIYMYNLGGHSADATIRFVVQASEDYYTLSSDWFYVAPEGIERFQSERMGALVGRQTAQELNLKVGSNFTVETELGPLPLVVSAISPRGLKATGIMPHYDYFAAVFKKEGVINTLWVEMTPGADVKSVGASVDEMFRNTSAPTKSFSASSSVREYSRMLRVVPSLLSIAGVLIILATLLVTANTLAITIRERTSDFAMLRALGFRRSRVLGLVLCEVMLVCLTGGALGGALPTIIFRNGVRMGEFTFGSVPIGWQSLGWVLVASTLLALAAGLVPAWRASRLNVVQALRDSG